MLTSLLPGFRKVRTPLVTGYLYLAALWLVLGRDLVPSTEDEGFLENIADLFDLFGPVAAAAALSVAAYLVGSVLVIARWPIVRNNTFSPFREGFAPTLSVAKEHEGLWALVDSLDVHQNALRRILEVLDVRVPLEAIEGSRELPHPFRITVAHTQERYQRDQERSLENFGDDPDYSGDEWNRATLFALMQGLLAVLPGEIGRVAATARVRFPALWDEYDQLRGEAEFRYSIAPPVLLICGSPRSRGRPGHCLW